MTDHELLLALRRTHSRAALQRLSDGVLTPAKVYNIERGRPVSAAESAAVRRLAAEHGVAASGDTPSAVSTAVQEAARPVDPAPPSVAVEAPLTAVPAGVAAAGSPSALTALDGLRRVSNSEVQSFKRCRRHWWLAWHRGLRERHESPVGVRQLGDRVHRALRRWYVPDVTQRVDPRDALETLVASDHDALYARDGGAWLAARPEVAARFKSEVDLARVVVAGYVEWLAETGADAEYVVIEPEAYLEAALPDLPDVRVTVLLDVRLFRPHDGVRLFVDHKVVGDLTRAVTTLHLDEQMLTYMLVERLQPDDDTYVAGAVYNMLKRVRRTVRASPPFYRRVEVHHNTHELAAFRRRLTGTISDMMSVERRLTESPDAHHDVAYPTPTPDCRWRCPFVQVCGMFDDGSRVEDALTGLYEVGDPRSYYTRGDVEEVVG